MLLITGKENGKTKRKRQCGKDLLLTTSSVYGTHKKEDIELFIERAKAYHPTHIEFTQGHPTSIFGKYLFGGRIEI